MHKPDLWEESGHAPVLSGWCWDSCWAVLEAGDPLALPHFLQGCRADIHTAQEKPGHRTQHSHVSDKAISGFFN